MRHLDSKLQQAHIKELQLAIEGQGMPVDVPSVYSCLKGLKWHQYHWHMGHMCSIYANDAMGAVVAKSNGIGTIHAGMGCQRMGWPKEQQRHNVGHAEH